MVTRARALHAVPAAEAPPAGLDAGRQTAGTEIPLLAAFLAIALLPLAGQAAGGHWGQGTLGVAAAAALLSGRRMVLDLHARARSRR